MGRPKESKNWCLVCGKRCKNSRSNLCKQHAREQRVIEFGNSITLDQLKATNSRHRFQTVRNHAHRMVKLFMPSKVCAVCGYDTYVELCHLKRIADFPREATLNEVNSLENLMWLCPNHHKELDLGLLANIV